ADRFLQRRRDVVHHHVEDRVGVRLVAERVDVAADVAAGANRGPRRIRLDRPGEHLRVEVGRLLAIAAADLEMADLIGHRDALASESRVSYRIDGSRGALRRRKSTISALTRSGCSCCTQWPAPSTKWTPDMRVHAVRCIRSSAPGV